MGDPVQDYKIEAWTLFAVGGLIVFVRLYARWKTVGLVNFCLDDYLMVLALAFDASLNALAHFMMKVGVTNSKISMEQRALMSQYELDQRALGSKIWMSGWSTYSAVVWTLKFCMIIFFNRVMTSLNRQHMIKWAFWFTGVSGVCVYLVFFLTCTPTYKLFQTFPYPGKQCEAETSVFYISTLCFNVLSDLFIISIPLPVLWHAKIPMRRKMMIMLLFGGGFFVIIAAILRCVLGLTSPVPTTTAQWACRETFVAIVIGNAPMIKPLFSRVSWAITNSSNNSKNNSKGYTTDGDVELSKRQKSKVSSKKGKSLMSITGDTVFASDSQEKIVMNDQESELGLQHHSKGHALDIVAETTYTISSQPVGDLESQQSGGSYSSNDGKAADLQHPGSSPTYRPGKGTYNVIIEGNGLGEKPKGVFPQFGNRQ